MIAFRRGLGATVSDLANAIARMEGYNVAGSIAATNNNPGNLRSGTGQIGTANGFAVFATPADGFAALDNQIQINENLGLNLNQFFAGEPGVYAGYAPSADSNNPATYAANVASWTGIDPTIPLTQALSPSASLPSLSLDPSTDSPSDSTSDSSDTSSLLDSLGLPTSLDLSAATGLSWPVLGGIAAGLFVLVWAVKR